MARHARELEAVREGFGDRFIDAWLKEVRLLAEHPFLGRVRRFRIPGVRSWQVGHPFENYLIFYHVTEQAVEIVRVLHGAMDLESIFREAPED